MTITMSMSMTIIMDQVIYATKGQGQEPLAPWLQMHKLPEEVTCDVKIIVH